MSRINRLLQKQTELSSNFELLSKKIASLRNAHALETNPGCKVQLDHEIQKLEAERETIEKYLEAVESLEEVTQIEEEANRITYGLEVIIEKLQMMDNHQNTMNNLLHLLLTHFGIRPVQ